MRTNKKPSIHFSEFNDAWEQRKFGEGMQKYQNTVYLEDNVSYKQVSIRNNGDVEYRDTKFGADIGRKRQYLIDTINHKTTLTFTRQTVYEGGIGFVPEALNGHIVTENMPLLDVNTEIFSPSFMKQLFRTPAYYKTVIEKNKPTGSAQKALHESTWLKCSLLYPTIEEQRKIGEYFDALDHLITLHQRKYEKLVNVRKSMLERLFPRSIDSQPVVRFKEFSAQWKKVRLGDIVVPFSEPVETPHNGYDRLGIRSHGKGVFHEHVDAGNELDTAQMHRVEAHNLIVNITFAWEHAVAITTEDDAGKLVSHRFPQFSMTEAICDRFLKYVILDSKFRHHLLLSSPGGAGRNRVLKVPEMLDYEMMIPEIKEQEKIADYMNSLDELIALCETKVAKLKNIKAACLQKMFV